MKRRAKEERNLYDSSLMGGPQGRRMNQLILLKALGGRATMGLFIIIGSFCEVPRYQNYGDRRFARR